MSEEMARYYMEEAQERFESARRALKKGRHGTAISYSQECAEYSVKAVMESLSIKYPPIHDVGSLVLRLKRNERLPNWFRMNSPKVSKIISSLADLMRLAKYGDQIKKIPPSKIFSKDDAEKTLTDAKFVYDLSKKFVEWWFRP